MLSNQRDSIKKWMLDTHRIEVQADWLEACLDWIHEEQQENNVVVANGDGVRSLVFEQWLMSDLRELNSHCLPDGLSDNIKIELNGNFPLQIESIVDIGSSCYSQLQKVKGTENANTGVSADTTLQSAWETKPSKMLYFKLTDGTSDIQAMEYKPLTSLGLDTILGTKILVYGSVICRRGVFLLTSDNTHVYGGEVDSLIENNTPEQVLQRALEANRQDAGKCERKEFSGRFIERGNNSFKKECRSQQTTSHSNQSRQFNAKPSMKQSASLNIKREPQNIKLESQNIKIEPQYTRIKAEPQIGSTGEQPFVNNGSNFSRPSTKPGASTIVKQELVDPDWPDDFEDDMFMDDIDDQVLISMETDASNSNSQIQQTNNTSSAINISIKGDNARKSQSDQTLTNNATRPSVSSNNIQTFTSRLQGTKSTRESTDTLLSRNKRQKLELKQQKIENMFTSVKREVITPEPPAAKNVGIRAGNLQTNNDEYHVDQFDQFNDDFGDMSDDDFDFVEPNISSVKVDVPKAVIHPFNSSNSADCSNNMNLEQIQNTVDQNDPFTYLSLISDQMPFTTEQTFRVKAYISTLTSKLTSGQGEVWMLACKINDGTMAMDVDLSNTVLTGLIGFSAEDSIIMRKQAKTDPSVKGVLLEGIQQCQQKLVDLSCILELKVKPYSIRPMITQIITIQKEHTESLLRRIQSKLSST